MKFVSVCLFNLRGEINVGRTSVFGLSENIASVLSYALLFFSGIVVLVMERENKTVRFHALQSTIWFIFITLASLIVGFIPWVGNFLNSVLGWICFASWLFLMYNAFAGKKFKIPMIGDVVESQISK